MTAAELTAEIKTRLSLTGTFHDGLITALAEDVKEYIKSAGADAESPAAVGVIARGVADLWNFGSGDGKFSEVFYQRVSQLAIEKSETKQRIKKVAPYLYEVTFNHIDYQAAAEYFKKYKPLIGGCSAVSNGNIFGRNYDWNYDERVEFIVHTPANEGRHSVIGVAAGTPDLTEWFIDNGGYSPNMNIVPFMLLDGINDAGLICEINIVPAGDKGTTRGTNPDKEDLFAMMITRYVLDYAGSVDEAITLLTNKNIFCADNAGVREEFHFMLADANKTVVIEFVENELKVISEFVNDKPIVTNFYLDGYDGTRESLTDYAMGIERQAILNDNYSMSDTEAGMLALMLNVKYTKAYSENENPLWYSEFCGGELTKDSPASDYAEIMNAARNLFANRQRDGKTWQTVHCSVYNRAEKKLAIIPQESGQIINFYLN